MKLFLKDSVRKFLTGSDKRVTYDFLDLLGLSSGFFIRGLPRIVAKSILITHLHFK